VYITRCCDLNGRHITVSIKQKRYIKLSKCRDLHNVLFCVQKALTCQITTGWVIKSAERIQNFPDLSDTPILILATYWHLVRGRAFVWGLPGEVLSLGAHDLHSGNYSRQLNSLNETKVTCWTNHGRYYLPKKWFDRWFDFDSNHILKSDFW